MTTDIIRNVIIIALALANVVLVRVNGKLNSKISEVVLEYVKLDGAKQNLCNIQRANYFGAGYIYGFRGAIKAMGLPGITQPLAAADIEARKFASEHGFRAADDDGDK